MQKRFIQISVATYEHLVIEKKSLNRLESPLSNYST